MECAHEFHDVENGRACKLCGMYSMLEYKFTIEYLKPIEFNPDVEPKPHPMLTRAQMLEKYPND